MTETDLHSEPLPVVSVEEMRELDRAMVEEFGIDLARMMENAGSSLARLIRRRQGGSVFGSRVVVYTGSGNNGGGGLVAARHLSNWGADVIVVLASEPRSVVAKDQLGIVEHIPEIKFSTDPVDAEGGTVVDTLIGYGLAGAPRGSMAEAISAINGDGGTVVALDIPSGLDGDSGEYGEACVRAAATLTLALPKKGLLVGSARGVVGELYLADISVPRALYERFGATGPVFKKSSIARVY